MENELDVKDDTPVKELDTGELIVGKEEPDGKEDDERLSSNEDASDEEQGHAAETDEEAEERRERNRARRQQNKASRKEYVESLKRELAARDSIIDELSTRVASVERQGQGNQLAQVDAAIKEAEQFYNHFKSVNRQAIEVADGAAAVDAQEKMFAAQQRHAMLLNAKKSMSQQVQAPPPLDPRVANNATSWMEKNSWYDPSGSDMDSDIVLQLDNRLVKDGWNPATSEYWDELSSRVKKYLPHRINSGYNKPQEPGRQAPRVPVSGSGEESSGSKKGTYRLSAERVQALKDAGVYDDPVKRADAIKRFQSYDRENGQNK